MFRCSETFNFFWKKGPQGQHRLSAAQLLQMSNKLEEMTGLFPSEFMRQSRGFDDQRQQNCGSFFYTQVVLF